MKKFIQSIVAVGSAALFVAFSATAQQSQTIAETETMTLTGRIVDDKGNPISLAIVKIMQIPESIEQRGLATSRNDGIFSFRGLSASKYHLWVTDLNGNEHEYFINMRQDNRCNLVFFRQIAGVENVLKSCINDPTITPVPESKSLVCPNPANSYATLNFTSENGGVADIELHASDGRIVAHWQQQADEGMNEVPVELAQFPVGQYFLKVSIDNHSDVLKLNIVR